MRLVLVSLKDTWVVQEEWCISKTKRKPIRGLFSVAIKHGTMNFIYSPIPFFSRVVPFVPRVLLIP